MNENKVRLCRICEWVTLGCKWVTLGLVVCGISFGLGVWIRGRSAEIELTDLHRITEQHFADEVNKIFSDMDYIYSRSLERNEAIKCYVQHGDKTAAIATVGNPNLILMTCGVNPTYCYECFKERNPSVVD